MIIDDDPFVLRMLARQLVRLGCDQVLPFSSARDALAAMSEGDTSVGLTICDLQMPEMDGVQFVGELGRIGYSGALAVASGEDGRILQTAEKLARAHGLHVLGALRKPVALDELRDLLARSAAHRAAIPRQMRPAYPPEDLRRALAEGELVNHYQPQIDVATGALVGVETLVRWHHPRDGMVFPDQFISTAEEHDLIDDVTHVVLTEALRQARRWDDAGLDLRVAVNVSMDNLAALGFPDFVAASAHDAGVTPTHLVLEVTESRLMKDQRAPLEILTRLALKRIGLSIDDFGTGHSSLAQLRDFPFDELKVDRSFIHGASRDSALSAIVVASCGMARQLGMSVVAEGVEDRADWDYVRACGCHRAQGYFMGRPMPAPDLQSWMVTWEGRCGELGLA